MFRKISILVFVISVLICNVHAQVGSKFGTNKLYKENQDLKLDLSNKILKSDDKNTSESILNKNINLSDDKKSPVVAVLLSLVIPGAGHFYEGRMDVGKYFLTGEVLSWLGYAGVTMYGNSVRDDSRTYAAVHSGLNKSGKDDNYYLNVGSFNTIYDYNNDAIQKGEYSKLYDPNSYFWSWDYSTNREFFDNQRKQSERIYNSQTIFVSVMVINRVVSAISSLIIANSSGNKTSTLKINTEAIYSRNNSLDGIRLNLLKSF
jgi:hypothetical protein